MTRRAAKKGGEVDTCPALDVLRGTMYDYDSRGHLVRRGPRHVRGDRGVCKFCGRSMR